MTPDIKGIKAELKSIHKELKTIRQNLPDKDIFLTAEESKLMAQSFQHEKEGKLISSKNLRKELGI